MCVLAVSLVFWFGELKDRFSLFQVYSKTIRDIDLFNFLRMFVFAITISYFVLSVQTVKEIAS